MTLSLPLESKSISVCYQLQENWGSQTLFSSNSLQSRKGYNNLVASDPILFIMDRNLPAGCGIRYRITRKSSTELPLASDEGS